MFYVKLRLAAAATPAAFLAVAAGVVVPPARAAEAPKAAPAAAVRRLSRDLFALRNAAGRAAAIGVPGGTTREAEAAVEAGLAWLAKAQEPDGSWNSERWGGAKGWDTGITGLALMAFLGAGYTHADGPQRAAVARGLEWLKGKQQPDGSFARRTFYEQGIATIAACEAYGLTQDREMRSLAERAVLFICREQPDHGGFRYLGGTRKEDGDLSVSGWQMTAIATGLCAGIESIPAQAIERSRTLLRNAFRLDGGSVYVVGTGQGTTTPSMAAVGMLCRELLGGADAEIEIRASAYYLLEAGGQLAGPDGPVGPRLASNLYTAYYSCLAMSLLGGKSWERWNALYREPLVKTQVAAEQDPEGRLLRGSWDTGRCQFGASGGRVYTTAMAVLCLETPYRYACRPHLAPARPAEF